MNFIGDDPDISFDLMPPCPGQEMGELLIDGFFGGQPKSPFSIRWSDGTNQASTNVNEGIYCVTVTDAINREWEGCYYVENSTSPNCDPNNCHFHNVYGFQLSNPSCNIAADGEVNLVLYNPVPDHFIQWNTGASGRIISNLSPGNYCVTLTEPNGCNYINCIDLQAQPLQLNPQITHSCDSDNGSIQLTPQGWSTPIAFEWENGSSSSNNNELAPGEYTVTVTNIDGCTTTQSFRVEGYSSELEGSIVSSTNASCQCCDDGMLTIEVANGSGQYAVIENGVEIISASSAPISINNVAYGTHEYTIVDNNTNCSFSISATVESSIYPMEIGIDNVEHYLAVNNPNYTELQRGAIDIYVRGGTFPFSYAWTATPLNFSFSTPDISNISLQGLTTIQDNGYNEFTVVVTDANGCTAERTINMHFNPKELVCNNERYVDQITPCISGTTLGKITGPEIRDYDGEPPYTYKWNGPGGFTGTGKTISGLTIPGTYTVTVTDDALQTCRFSYELICDCNDLRADYHVDHCDRKDKASVKLRSVDTDGPINNPYQVFFDFGPDKKTVTFNLNDDRRPDRLVFAKTYGYTSGRLVCVTISDRFGCKDQQCFEFYRNNQCIYSIVDDFQINQSDKDTKDPFQNNINDNLPQIAGFLRNNYGLDYGDFMGLCRKDESCDNDIEFGPMVYTPNKADEPCTGGGIIKCQLCPEDGTTLNGIQVPANYTGIQMEYDGHCMCYFPPGIITDEKFISASLGANVNNFWTLPVISFYDCDGPITESPTENPKGPPACTDIFPGCDNCAIVPIPENCEYEYFCASDALSTVVEVPADYKFCSVVTGNHSACTFYLSCVLDPCVGIDDLALDCSGGCPEETINGFLPPDKQISCGFDEWCTCEELSSSTIKQSIPECVGCEQGGRARTSPVVNPKVLDNQQLDYGEDSIKLNSLVNIFGDKTNKLTNEINVYPNPFNHQVKVQFFSEVNRTVSIRLFDVLGSEVYQSQFSILKGENILDIPLGEIPTGVYHLVIQKNTILYKTRLIRTNF
ncbi:MAG: T9SS type A sorting domain-containing protein [Bacteroidota bacterium]